MKSFLAAALALSTVLSISSPAHADWFGEAQPPTQVTPLIWRSSRPDQAMLNALYAHGLRAIVDLEDDETAVENEAVLAKKMGMAFYSYPTNSFFQPDDAKMKEILNLLRTTKVPILVHCLHGEDRTGLVIGLERFYLEKWSPAKAYDEMLDHGFHQILLGLDQYFRDKTGSF